MNKDEALKNLKAALPKDLEAICFVKSKAFDEAVKAAHDCSIGRLFGIFQDMGSLDDPLEQTLDERREAETISLVKAQAIRQAVEMLDDVLVGEVAKILNESCSCGVSPRAWPEVSSKKE